MFVHEKWNLQIYVYKFTFLTYRNIFLIRLFKVRKSDITQMQRLISRKIHNQVWRPLLLSSCGCRYASIHTQKYSLKS